MLRTNQLNRYAIVGSPLLQGVVATVVLVTVPVVPRPRKGNGRRLNGNSPFPFGGQIVRDRVPVIDTARFSHYPRQGQHSFRDSGLAGIDVGKHTDIPNLTQPLAFLLHPQHFLGGIIILSSTRAAGHHVCSIRG